MYAHFRGDPASMYSPEIERTTCTRPENIFILENIFIVTTSQPTNENHCRRSRIVQAPHACLQSESSKFQAPRRHLVSSSDSSSSVDADELLECCQISVKSAVNLKLRRRGSSAGDLGRFSTSNRPAWSRRATNGDAACAQSSMMR
jgi:hypothetical protein